MTTTYRHWQPGDDPGVMAILAPMGWCTPERYATKFDDAGLRPEDVLIAERDGRIVGHLMLPHRRLRFGQTSLPFGGVGQVVVDPAVRGQGIGAALLDAALDHHRRAGNALAGLTSGPSLQPAYSMYQHRGFAPVAHRLTLHLPLLALGRPPAGLSSRPVTPADRPALARLLDAWAAEHAGVSVEAADELLDGDEVVVDASGRLLGRYQRSTSDPTQPIRRLLAQPDVPLATILAAGPATRGGDLLSLATNRESRVYAELAHLALHEEHDGFVLMLAPLDLVRLTGGLALELAARLRRLAAPATRLTLTLAETTTAVAIDWDGRALILTRPTPADPPATTLSHAALVQGLSGQPPPSPSPALAGLWSALFPPLRTEARLVNCW